MQYEVAGAAGNPRASFRGCSTPTTALPSRTTTSVAFAWHDKSASQGEEEETHTHYGDSLSNTRNYTYILCPAMAFFLLSFLLSYFAYVAIRFVFREIDIGRQCRWRHCFHAGPYKRGQAWLTFFPQQKQQKAAIRSPPPGLQMISRPPPPLTSQQSVT